jgi:phage-related protein
VVQEQEYEIVYYRDKTKWSPVEEFIKGLPDKDKVKILAHIKLLREKGFLPYPFTSDVRDVKKLRELRIRFSFNFYRIFYFMFTGKKIVLLHGFSKKSNKTPQREIEIAQKRMEDFVRKERLRDEEEKG